MLLNCNSQHCLTLPVLARCDRCYSPTTSGGSQFTHLKFTVFTGPQESALYWISLVLSWWTSASQCQTEVLPKRSHSTHHPKSGHVRTLVLLSQLANLLAVRAKACLRTTHDFIAEERHALALSGLRLSALTLRCAFAHVLALHGPFALPSLNEIE